MNTIGNPLEDWRMADPRQVIKEWVDARPGRSFKKLSQAIGRNQAYVHQYVKTGTPKVLPERERYELAREMGLDEKALRDISYNPGAAATTPANARISGNVSLQSTIPMYGQAVGGKDGKFVLNGNKMADVLAPPSLIGVPDAYAVLVVGESMEPRYFSGEAVFVNPRLPVRRNDFVVVQLKSENDGEPAAAYIKRYISWDSKLLKLEQFRPKKLLQFPSERVLSVHRIIMGGDS